MENFFNSWNKITIFHMWLRKFIRTTFQQEKIKLNQRLIFKKLFSFIQRTQMDYTIDRI